MKYLYRDFHKDKKVHSLNEAFYKRLLKAVTGSQPAPYFRKVYGNGEKIYDDHIFSTMYNDRILQVIQLEPVSEQPFLKARVQKWDNQYDMLVLSLELSDAVKPDLEKIIRAWLVEGVAPEQLKGLLPWQDAKGYSTGVTKSGMVNEDTPE
ncbi:MAG: hypothetical protein ACKV1O_19160 [Saprospiraceae bacterium]